MQHWKTGVIIPIHKKGTRENALTTGTWLSLASWEKCIPSCLKKDAAKWLKQRWRIPRMVLVLVLAPKTKCSLSSKFSRNLGSMPKTSAHGLSTSRKHSTGSLQGRNNHWANRANVRGLALGYQNAPLLVFHIFRLSITRQNCRAFWLLRLVYRSGKLVTLAFIIFEWLKRIETNSTALYDPRIRSKSVHPVDVRRTFSRVGQRPNFADPLQVADDAM